jgi:hypothetical protein
MTRKPFYKVLYVQVLVAIAIGVLLSSRSATGSSN